MFHWYAVMHMMVESLDARWSRWKTSNHVQVLVYCLQFLFTLRGRICQSCLLFPFPELFVGPPLGVNVDGMIPQKPRKCNVSLNIAFQFHQWFFIRIDSFIFEKKGHSHTHVRFFFDCRSRSVAENKVSPPPTCFWLPQKFRALGRKLTFSAHRVAEYDSYSGNLFIRSWLGSGRKLEGPCSRS